MKRLTSSIVADGSLVVKWVVAEEDSDKAKVVGLGRTLLAPDLLLVECANILWRHQRRGEIGQDTAMAALTVLQAGPFTWTRDSELVGDACRLSTELNHPVYDCLYLALARQTGVPVVTADLRFAGIVQRFPAFSGSVLALNALE